jgi:hypothetical protein
MRKKTSEDLNVDLRSHYDFDYTRMKRNRFGGLDALDATIVSCDRLGFLVRVRTAEGRKGTRIAFPEPVASREDARKMFVAMTQQSR